MRRTTGSKAPGFVVTGVLVAALAGCGSEIPAGALSEDDLPDGVSVEKVTHDVQANQVQCQDVNDAEDNHVVGVSANYNEDNEAAVSFELEGSGSEYVADSVWKMYDSEVAVSQVSRGLDVCIKDNPTLPPER